MVKEDRDGARDENGERDGDVERRKKQLREDGDKGLFSGIKSKVKVKKGFPATIGDADRISCVYNLQIQYFADFLSVLRASPITTGQSGAPRGLGCRGFFLLIHRSPIIFGYLAETKMH